MKITLRKEYGNLIPYNEESAERLNKLSNAVYECDIKNMDERTIQQNKALHVWCKKISDLLNSKAMYAQGIFGNDIIWTMTLVKELIVKQTISKIFGVSSTTKLKRKEIDELVMYVTKAFGLKGVQVPEFPNKEAWEEEKSKT